MTADTTAAAARCRKCQQHEAQVTVRSEGMCRHCFMRYVSTKFAKRMESFRVRNSTKDHQPTLLVPISLGVSSLVLLHLLDAQLGAQLKRTGRSGYRLSVLFVDCSHVVDGAPSSEHLPGVEQRFPHYDLSSLPLAAILNYDSQRFSAPDESDKQEEASISNEQRLTRLLSSLPSATSRSDITSILRTRLVLEVARSKGCESVLWADSTTRLAERTLAETAKGRGMSLPSLVSDGPSPCDISVHYPLQDLLRNELLSFSALLDPPLTPLVRTGQSPQPSGSAASMTIDGLMAQYFESVEENYPSIVANVVRTSRKLTVTTSSDHGDRRCSCALCGVTMARNEAGLYGWGGDQSHRAIPETATASMEATEEPMCYGCARSVLGAYVPI
ncbi:MAG: cytoplasmic tRNA 2-thiolation protein 2 [Caeruleum heppii]|nr:MAG: cytoplasmic tRNA 2-thiolation protein 2 [Caeruleum heppii]